MKDQQAPVQNPPAVPPEVLLDCIFRLGRVMEQVDTKDHLIRTIIEECRRLFDCEAASLAIYHPERNDLEFIASKGGAEIAILNFRIPLGQGIIGLVAQTGQGIIVNNPATHPSWHPQMDHSTGFTTRNLAAVPIHHASRLVGSLEAINIRREGGFQDQDLYVLQIFADQIGTVLETQRLLEEKMASDRLAAFAVALTDIGHSIKNLLLRLGMPITLIDEAIKNRDWTIIENAWPVLRRASGEVGDLVKQMLYYAKPQQPNYESADLRQLIVQILDVCREDAQNKGIRLGFEAPAETLIRSFDPALLRPAIYNLVGNAIEAIADHGGSTVTVRLDPDSSPGATRISIHDDGPGIPLEIQNRIFDPFFSTKQSKGTGLGLANARKAAEEHNGRLELVSSPGDGATFTLYLPGCEPKRL